MISQQYSYVPWAVLVYVKATCTNTLAKQESVWNTWEIYTPPGANKSQCETPGKFTLHQGQSSSPVFHQQTGFQP